MMISEIFPDIGFRIVRYCLRKGCLKISFEPLSGGGFCGHGSLFGYTFDCRLDAGLDDYRDYLNFVFLDTHR